MNDMPFQAPKRGWLNRVFGFAYGLKSSDRFLFALAACAVLGSGLWALATFDEQISVETPARDGAFTEGIIGTPRFINPILAVTRADQDMAALVYAGLSRLRTEGSLEPDIAETITVSEDGLVYNVVLRRNAVFHDGTPVTAHDVAFTVAQIQDPSIASPLRSSWDGVSVEVIGDYEINFVLTSPYAPFRENLTVGILPRHIWQNASGEEFPFSQFNSEPVGAGAYRVRHIDRDESGIPRSYTLEPHREYHREAPKIESLTLTFYPNEEKLIEAWHRKEVDSVAGLAPETIAKLELDDGLFSVVSSPLPRTFAVFFNQNKSATLRDPDVRIALDAAIDRDDLITAVLSGYGQPLHSPIPAGFGVEAGGRENAAANALDTARSILREAGWQLNADTGIWEKALEEDADPTPLAFSISTANAPVFEATAEYLRSKWEQLGVQVTVKQFEQSDLTQAVIRPRDYEALLFGTALGRALDFYPFWHSSQRNDPGLNVALYANITTDSILEDLRTGSADTEQAEAYQSFREEIEAEMPAVFLYAPEFTYVLPKAIEGTSFTGISELHERFANIDEWYIETESIWPIFNN